MDLPRRSVCATLSIADKHSVPSLRESCVSFIVMHFKQVHKTEGFKHLSRDLLDLVHIRISEQLDNQHSLRHTDGSSTPKSPSHYG
mmetsp:Transcript_85113/g.170040  ORF Transcript_85113/g.170040 Transcript_85113/m.170040 type:complete len:86 (+) Transcript_85113:111-368(+)